MEFLSNPWVVGIGGGVLSGAFVTIVARYIIGKRENREYLQKALSGNRELVYALRSGISEGVVPLREVVEALVRSTARKHGVAPSDLYSPAEIGEELVREVMDTSFLSATKKSEHCALLGPLITPQVAAPATADVAPAVRATELKSRTLSEYRQRLVSMMSMALGLLTALMTGVVVLLRVDNSIIPARFEALLPMLVVTMTVLISMATRALLRLRATRGSRREAGSRDKRQSRETNEPRGRAI